MMSALRFIADVPKVAGFTIARLRRSRLAIVLLLGLLAGALVTLAIAFAASRSRSSGEVFLVISWWALSMGLLPWVGIFLGVTAVHGDLEDQTCQYLFSAPISRPAALVGKWLGASLVAALVAALATATAYMVVNLAPVRWDDGRGVELSNLFAFLQAQALAMAAYVAVAALCGAWFKRPLVWAIFYVVGIENVMSNLPASVGLRSLTISDPMRRMLLDGLAIDTDSTMFRTIWPAARFFRDGWRQGTPVYSMVWFIGTVLILAVFIYCKREYGSRQD